MLKLNHRACTMSQMDGGLSPAWRITLPRRTEKLCGLIHLHRLAASRAAGTFSDTQDCEKS